MDFKRADRVAGLIKEEISAIIQRDVQDPRVMLSTITEVKLSDDLKCARIYFVCDSEKKQNATEGLNRSKGFIKKKLAERLTLRYMPDIKFFYDSSLDYSNKIEKILKKITPDDDK